VHIAISGTAEHMASHVYRVSLKHDVRDSNRTDETDECPN